MIATPHSTVAMAAEAADAKKAYQFASPPKTITPSLRTGPNLEAPSSGNMMFDRRIYRGSNYGLPNWNKNDPNALAMKLKAKRKRNKDKGYLQARVSTPDAVAGRQHIAMQTDIYLEELVLKVPERDVFTMTDAFIDRPLSPIYVPIKSGVDASTQIYEGELFDFDVEVEPILQVLVGKVVEQSFMEVLEEEELKMLKAHQVSYENQRNAELAEVQRLEEAERRRVEEKERRLAEQKKLYQEKLEMAEKIAAQNEAQMMLRQMIPNVFDALTTNGFFYDVVETQVDSEFLPWITHQVLSAGSFNKSAYALLDHLIRDAIKMRRQMTAAQ